MERPAARSTTNLSLRRAVLFPVELRDRYTSGERENGPPPGRPPKRPSRDAAAFRAAAEPVRRALRERKQRERPAAPVDPHGPAGADAAGVADRCPTCRAVLPYMCVEILVGSGSALTLLEPDRGHEPDASQGRMPSCPFGLECEGDGLPSGASAFRE